MMIDIRSRWSGDVLFAVETSSRRLAVEAAVKSEADLRGANLHGADLYEADLYGANLYGADLYGADLYEANLYEADLRGAKGPNGRALVGERPFVAVGPLGSRMDYLYGWLTAQGLWCVAGCWSGTLEEFRARAREVYGDAPHGQEYQAACDYLAMHATLWMPVPVEEAVPCG